MTTKTSNGKSGSSLRDDGWAFVQRKPEAAWAGEDLGGFFAALRMTAD
jgi:hypothetical protein